MLNHLKNWQWGCKIIAFMLFMVGLHIAAMAIIVTIVAELLIYLLGSDQFALSDHYNDILFLSVAIMAPYSIATHWKSIEKLALETHPSVKDPKTNEAQKK